MHTGRTGVCGQQAASWNRGLSTGTSGRYELMAGGLQVRKQEHAEGTGGSAQIVGGRRTHISLVRTSSRSAGMLTRKGRGAQTCRRSRGPSTLRGMQRVLAVPTLQVALRRRRMRLHTVLNAPSVASVSPMAPAGVLSALVSSREQLVARQGALRPAQSVPSTPQSTDAPRCCVLKLVQAYTYKQSSFESPPLRSQVSFWDVSSFRRRRSCLRYRIAYSRHLSLRQLRSSDKWLRSALSASTTHPHS